ncbi:MAG: alpha-2-macroglobulin [Lentisphaerae bacterium RIFOXYB12_FULL_65_16]|nr:MAG: alpha-2-macroglobulin [Lentisphaerae bacterium RIFOXYA12_64_32]OGV93686.1 MAG: alpha-2-macroglobulin [Lentisphaerae bacterium RIFOXYB12_FULL_65_16]
MSRTHTAMLIAMLTIGLATAAHAGQAEDRQKATKLYQDGNYQEAHDLFRTLALAPDDDPAQVGNDLNMAVTCLCNLNRINEMDALREGVIEVHAKNWQLLRTAAQNYLGQQHFGFTIAGKFERGQHRGGGKMSNAEERDRVRALQLYVMALPLVAKDPNRGSTGYFYLEFANAFLSNRGYTEAWRLQATTDLATLPDYDEGYGMYYYGGGQVRGAPVDEDGNPVFHRIPKSFEDAGSDGERWRWLLMQAAETDARLRHQVAFEFANFLDQQFGTQTLAQYSWFQRTPDEDAKDSVFALHSLAEDETIARLANGVKRFKLPDEFNFVRIYQQLAADRQTGYGEQSLNTLAQTFENRQQYNAAAKYWQRSIDEYGTNDMKRERLEQIMGNWGQFEPARPQAAGAGAAVDFRFRNARKLSLQAYEVKVPELLADIKAYLKSNPRELDYNKVQLGEIGYRLVTQNQTKYIGAKVADWTLDLKPRPEHFDRRITVSTPLQKPGAYLVTGTVAGGNTSRIVLWVADTAIVKKPLDKQTLYFVADAKTGAPVVKANLEFFGYRMVYRETKRGLLGRPFDIVVNQFAESTDANGQVILGPKEHSDQFQWLIIATTPDGRFAYHGFTGMWYPNYYDNEYSQLKPFFVTDRPVYRPGQTVKFKAWVRHAKYDEEDVSATAGQSFRIEMHNPQGEEVFQKDFQADEYGGFDGEYVLPKDAALGVFQLQIPGVGGSSFRVEEYKKPEFEVTVEAPTEPVMLGEMIPAKIQAKYYFGAPVVKAKVKYKVLRYSHTANWYPPMPWDWFYGTGYWWFAYDYPWYPGWGKWGCFRPHCWWIPWSPAPPEVVLDREVEIGADGTVNVEIDTRLAKEIHGDQDHRYEITAEVVDESRRTIVGTGQVLVAREPFKVYTWVDRGHYSTGDVIHAAANARTVAGKPVKAKGPLCLFRVTYDKDGNPTEKEAQRWDVETNDDGQVEMQMKASAAGQYRLACKLTDAAGHTIEGGYVFVVTGQGFDGAKFRFNDIELVPDKREYAPGETVKLMINTNRVQGTVLLFVRPANGICLPPKLIQMTGKSVIEEIAITKKDMPNFFVEALTVSDARIYSEVKEIVVPPEKRVLNVEVLPSATTYKPGETAKVRLKLTDFLGKPFKGSLVMTVYDKAVEYISGGSNVPEIKAFFWKWRRNHHAQQETNLDPYSQNVLKERERGMRPVGVFGDNADMEGAAEETTFGGPGGGRGGFGGKGGARLGAVRAFKSKANMQMADGMAMAASAPMAEGEEAKKEMVADEANGAAAGGGGPEAPQVQPVVRTQFADTAFWKAVIATDADGFAEVEFKMPENLTGWKIKVWGMGHGTKVGEGDALVTTAKNLMLRLQAPRFFVEKDEVVLSANIHNYLTTAKDVEAVLELDGGTLEAMGELRSKIKVDANGEQRVDWRVKVVKEGEAVVRMKALTDEESDAMEMKFPVYVHGMDKMVPVCGLIRPDKDSATVTLDVPEQRRVNASRLEIRYSPTLAAAMVDALPYMVEYPYGCTEQTLNKFLPTVMTQKILLDMGVPLKAIRDKRTNLNAQEIGNDQKRAADWKRVSGDYRWDGEAWVPRNPIFDEDTVRDMVKVGVNRLTSMQCSDGGWGWFSGWGESSSPHTTAYVVHGLQVARDNDVALVPGVLERGVEWLKNYQAEQVRLLKRAPKKAHPWKEYADNLDAFVYMVLADADQQDEDMREFLYRDRTQLAVYGKAMYGLALHKQGHTEKRDMIVRNIEQYLVTDEENQTAYLNLGNEGYWWYWYGSEYEAHAYYLKLLARVDPKGTKAPYLVKYLLNNRKHASYWNSTRDTAICLEAFADYIRASGEDKPDMTVEILVDGKKQKEVRITPDVLFTFDNKVVLVGDAIESGKHTIEFRKNGTGPLYFNAYLSYFSLEDYIKKAGLEIKVDRQIYKLNKVDKSVKVAGSRGQAVDQKVEKYARELLPDLATLKSGDLVEVELVMESKNDYEYIVFEDMKAAGFEPVEVRSGYGGNDMGAYMELRDERVCFFVRALARGKHSISYRLRAEIPGTFSALPARGYAMYAPELRANSDEIKLKIED